MTFTIVLFPPTRHEFKQLQNKLFILPKKHQHVHYIYIYFSEYYLKQPIQLSAAGFLPSEALISSTWTSP